MIIRNAVITGAVVQDASIVSSGSQLLYLDAGFSPSYPGSGSTWYDLSANKNNTTGTTGTTYSFSNNGYFNFNGSGYFTTASSKYNVVYTGKTTFFAANLASAMGSGTYRNLFGCSGGNRNFNTYLYYNGSTYQIHFSTGGYGGLSNGIVYVPGTWFTCGVTHTTAGLMSFYFNGQPVGSTSGLTFSQYLSSTSEQVGASDNYWLGPISVACIYGSALSAQQMKVCHNAVAGRYGLATV